MSIAMYLGASKYWWASLALQSNLALAQRMSNTGRHAVLFDHPSRLPPTGTRQPLSETHFFYVLWDGIVDAASLERAAAMAEGSRGLTLLTVGEMLRIPSAAFEVLDLFAGGTLHFGNAVVRFDPRTRAVLALSQARNVLMPLKNLRQGDLGAGLDLLWGKRRLVFCGSYGITQETLRQLGERHEVAGPLDEFPFVPGGFDGDAETYRGYLAQAGSFLATLAASHRIDNNFLFSAMHLLGREFCLRHMQQRGWPLFVNGYASGANINVYTTPWYRQHVFPDFGSAVGRGNYPRLADLRYYRKRTVPLEMIGSLAELSDAAAKGRLEQYFEQRWNLYEAVLTAALA